MHVDIRPDQVGYVKLRGQIVADGRVIGHVQFGAFDAGFWPAKRQQHQTAARGRDLTCKIDAGGPHVVVQYNRPLQINRIAAQLKYLKVQRARLRPRAVGNHCGIGAKKPPVLRRQQRCQVAMQIDRKGVCVLASTAQGDLTGHTLGAIGV